MSFNYNLILCACLNLIKKWPLSNKKNFEITSEMSFNAILLFKGIRLTNELELWSKFKNVENIKYCNLK